MSPASLPIFILLVSGIPCLIRPAAARCELKNCGRLANISQPFWLRDLQQPGTCGSPAFELTCEDNLPVLANVNYPFLHIQDIFYQNKSFLVNYSYFYAGDCQIPHHNLSLNHPDRFRVSSANRQLFFFRNCTAPPSNVAKMVQCAGNGTFAYLGGRYGVAEPLISSSACNKSIMVPVLLHERDEKGGSSLGSLSKNGFLVEYEYDGVDYCLECRESGGECSQRDKFKCICRDGRSELRRCRITLSHFLKNIVIGSTTGVGLLLVSTVLFLYVLKRKRSKETEKIEVLLKEYGPLAPKRFKYSDLKKITDSFGKKLGQGGFGSVFQGKLHDGCLVAVKILNKIEENGSDFINEVASISRTSHVNIVGLLGFCLDGHRRALIYEFMPNGSLDKYIYADKPKAVLSWDKLYQIAIGIARGLEYLHRGCNTRIVHFDIKPQNILLDENFYPKISDFGLAKLCLQKESILSMAEARGTIGYIAPEVFSRTFGVVSAKSDVYSYGMMLLEMVGGRKNAKACVDRSSEVYFPHWIYDHLDREGGLQAYDVTEETEEMARKITLVGLWCMQTKPTSRPSMTRVVEMLEGSVSDLEMPPKPEFSSPVRSVVNSPIPSLDETCS